MKSTYYGYLRVIVDMTIVFIFIAAVLVDSIILTIGFLLVLFIFIGLHFILQDLEVNIDREDE